MGQNLIDLKGEIDESNIIRDFKTLLSEVDRFSRQKISEDIVKLKNTINQLSIIDSYRLLHPTKAE